MVSVNRKGLTPIQKGMILLLGLFVLFSSMGNLADNLKAVVHGIRTTGTVKGVNVEGFGLTLPRRTVKFLAKVEFVAPSGEKVTFQDYYRGIHPSLHPLKEGQEVEVVYDPAMPSRARILNVQMWVWPALGFLVGLFLGITGLLGLSSPKDG